MATYSDEDILSTLHDLGFDLRNQEDLGFLRDGVNAEDLEEYDASSFYQAPDDEGHADFTFPNLDDENGLFEGFENVRDALRMARATYERCLPAIGEMLADVRKYCDGKNDADATDDLDDALFTSLYQTAESTLPSLREAAAETNENEPAGRASVAPTVESSASFPPLRTPRTPFNAKEFMARNGLREVACPEPGRLPVRHDNLKRLQMYRELWAKNPPPNEQSRRQLRWKVRGALLRREIPVVRMGEPNAASITEQTRPDWAD
ncbi:HYLS1-C domain-containing protein [Aphelenchoides fujianensis]|nr:HYLS1-C domain-containing protein [Aphelenchoides fujianensis]